jgi:hypothetical protein
MNSNDTTKNNHIRTITTTHYLKEEPEDIVIDCDTGRGKEIIGSLWDSLMKENYEYISIPGVPRTLTKVTECKRGDKTYHLIDRFILPI